MWRAVHFKKQRTLRFNPTLSSSLEVSAQKKLVNPRPGCVHDLHGPNNNCFEFWYNALLFIRNVTARGQPYGPALSDEKNHKEIELTTSFLSNIS
jgi:hypothetical protein